MKATGETGVLRACLDLLRLRGVFAWRNNSTGVYDAAAKRFRTFNGLRGTSDILGVVRPGGRFLAVEAKHGKNRLSRDQEYFQAATRDNGGLACVAYSVKELDEFLAENGL